MNSKKMCFVINQYGSLFYLLPIFKLINQKKIKIIIFSNLNLSSKKNFNKSIQPISIRKISKFKIIITDAVVGNIICRKIVNLKKSYVIQFLDGWSYIKDRFIKGNKIFFGNEIWTPDNYLARKIKLITKGKCKIYKMGHPGYERFLNKNKKIKKKNKKKILIVLQNFKELNFVQSQYKTIDYFEKIFSKIKKQYKYFYLLHPGTNKNKYKNLKNIIRFKDDNEITKFTHVIGYYSTLVILPFILKIKTAIIYKDKKKIRGVEDLLEKFKIRRLYDSNDILKFFNENPSTPKVNFVKERAKFKIINRICKLQHIHNA
tara:strand:+ start:323 stop:1273 length:951 start_codon:yes stop_codon:yes gene_type:complete